MIKRAIIKKIVLIFSFIMITVVNLVACSKKEEEYRQIQVYKIDGTATVSRAGSSMEVYENMQLQSEDTVETAENSYLQLKLDEDKYILLEAETRITLQATGSSVDSNTAIFLEKGAIVNQLDHPLNEKSSYQVTTPNATMAVRGTTFRVEVTYDKNRECFTKVAVYDGKVEYIPLSQDGTKQESVILEAGTEIVVKGNNDKEEGIIVGQVSYEELKEKVLEFLNTIISRGQELSISKDEIKDLIEKQKKLEKGEAKAEEVSAKEEELPEEELKEELDPKDKKEPKKEEKPLKKADEKTSIQEQKQEVEQITTQPDNVAIKGNTSEGNEGTSGSGGNTSTGENSSGGNGGSSGSSGSGSTGGNPSGGSGSTSGSNGNTSTGGNTSEESGGSSDGSGDTSEGGDTTEGEVTKTSITVQFYIGDSLFAYKEVEIDNSKTSIIAEDITEPLLRPDTNGGWDYSEATITNGVAKIKWK